MGKFLEPGSQLDGGKYTIVRHLGEGGMGTVFEAEQRETHKRVAIKCLHPHQAGDPEITERLLREARATARVRHPNVVDIYDVGRDGSQVYLVMEYLEGEPLSLAMARNTLPPWEAITLLMDAMRGVAAAHAQGITHRDIKPDNIFLAKVADARRPVAKVLDFGISKLASKTAGARVLTRSGTAVGTPSYMSFEQLNGENIDGRADVYAFGVILYEILTGRVPHEADTFPQLLMRFATRAAVPPKQLRPEIPGALDRLVMWALEKDREDRIASVEALLREVDPFSTQRGFEAEQTSLGDTRTPYTLDTAARTLDSQAGPKLAAAPHSHTRATLPNRRLHGVLLMVVLAAALAAAWLIAMHRAEPVETEESRSAATETPLVRPESASPAQPGAVVSPKAPAPTLAKPVTPPPPPPAPKVEPVLPQGRTPPKAAPPPPPPPPTPTRPVNRPIGPRPRDLGVY